LAPVRVSEDHWQIDACPEDGPSTVVTPDGVLHIAWPTLLEGANPKKAIFYSWSADGGRTFAPRVRIDANGNGEGAHPQIAATASGVVVVWEDRRDGHHAVLTREIPSAHARMVTPGPIASVNGPDDEGFYPAVAESNGAVLVAWTSKRSEQATIHISRR
jgi:hypothetical protein